MVSVIIPTYNDAQWLSEAIDSVLATEFGHGLEIIVVDDCSTEESSKAKLAELEGIYSEVKFIRNKKNGHLAHSRNEGIKVSQYPYILPLDADDKIDKGFIQKAYNLLQEKEDVIAVTAWANLFGDVQGVRKVSGGGIDNFLRQNNSFATALYRKSLWDKVGGYNEEMKRGYEDWDFWLRGLSATGGSIQAIEEPLFFYRQRRNSMVKGTNQKHHDILAEMLNRLFLTSSTDIQQRLFNTYFDKAATQERANKEMKASARRLFKALARRIVVDTKRKFSP